MTPAELLAFLAVRGGREFAATAFDRSGEPAPFAITATAVPPLASFVVGLVTLASAVPQGMSWLALQIMRGRADASLMDPNPLPPFDQHSAGTGAEVVARLVVGAVLAVSLALFIDWLGALAEQFLGPKGLR